MASSASTSISPLSKMMKLAIAGTNGFAQYLAHYIESTTPHQFVILSRRANSGLTVKNWQIIVTNYSSVDELTYLLVGVDVVISTIAGSAQIALIDAAAAAGVTRFVPSEFSSSPLLRTPQDLTDNGRLAALERLQYYELQQKLKYTVFLCGMFYERFAPGGLAASQINTSGSLGGEGEPLINMRRGQAVVFGLDSDIYISLISARDAARSVVAALSLSHWDREYTFCAQRLSLVELTDICQRVKGSPFVWFPCDSASLIASLDQARATQNRSQQMHYTQLLDVVQGKYDLTSTNVDLSVSIHCEGFEQWLANLWPSNNA